MRFSTESLAEEVGPPSVGAGDEGIFGRWSRSCELDVFSVVFFGIEAVSKPNLAHIAQANRGLAFVLCYGEGGQEHRRQNRNDCDHDKKFDEREGFAFGLVWSHSCD